MIFMWKCYYQPTFAHHLQGQKYRRDISKKLNGKDLRRNSTCDTLFHKIKILFWGQKQQLKVDLTGLKTQITPRPWPRH